MKEIEGEVSARTFRFVLSSWELDTMIFALDVPSDGVLRPVIIDRAYLR